MLKKILSLTLAVFMLLSVAACKKEDTSSGSEGASSAITSSEAASEENTSSKTDADVSSKAETEQNESTQPTASEKACEHKYSKATCTTAAKCTLCGETSGKALGHNYAAGKCSRCGAVDKSYATYKSGGQDSIIRTTADGKSTTLKIDISAASGRLNNIKGLDPNAKMELSYNNFLEVEGYLYFSQTIRLIYTFGGTAYDVKVDEVYKIKTDGTKQSEIVCYKETEDKAIGVSEVFGFIGNEIYYILEDGDVGTFSIYKATVSSALTNLISQGKKVADSANAYAMMYNASVKNGQLYFSEKKYTFNPSTNKTEYTELGNYKINTNGKGLTKI